MTSAHSNSTGLLGGIEAGGTNFNCVVATTPSDIIERVTVPTTAPVETLPLVESFFKQAASQHGNLSSLGIACFGPVDICKQSDGYGTIGSTPKADWANTNLLSVFSDLLSIPIGFNSDVNGAAIGEQYHGAGKQLDNFVYVTVGTGIGAGVISNGQLLGPNTHPEIGHLLIPHNLQNDPFPGCCPYHGDCLEGLASGTAIRERWGIEGKAIPSDHKAWELQSHYLAILCVNLTYCYSPEKIIFGGGVANQSQLFPAIRNQFIDLINGYSCNRNIEDIDNYIVPSGLNGRAGEIGALVLAETVNKKTIGIPA